MVALVLVAVSLGLNNLVAAVGIGITGVDLRTRLRVGLVFGLFEGGMPAAGLLIGRGLATAVGHAARWPGAALLIVVGGYGLVRVLRKPKRGDVPGAGAGGGGGGRKRTAALLLSGLALSTDNLAVGFALGTYRVGLVVGAVVIGVVSVTMSLAGLELGARIGRRAGPSGELIGGFALIAAGVVIAAGVR